MTVSRKNWPLVGIVSTSSVNSMRHGADWARVEGTMNSPP